MSSDARVLSPSPSSSASSSRADAAQSVGLMIGALLISAMLNQHGADLVLGVLSFCLFLMVLIAGTLLVIEGRVLQDRPDPAVKFCLPAIGLLGVCLALAVAGGYLVWAVIVLIYAFSAAAYRRASLHGPFNLIPSAALDMGVVAGVGASLTGLVVALASLLLA